MPHSGVFDAADSYATAVWQSHHYNLTVDGVVGTNTWNAARFWHLGPVQWQDATWKAYYYTDTSQGSGYSDAVYFYKPWAIWKTPPLWCQTGPDQAGTVMITGDSNTGSWDNHCE